MNIWVALRRVVVKWRTLSGGLESCNSISMRLEFVGQELQICGELLVGYGLVI